MSVDTIAKTTVTSPFPKTEVEAALRKELLDVATSIASIHGTPMPAGIAQQSALPIQLDSLAVVDVLCSIEPVVGHQIKDHVVKAGGYGSVDEAINELLLKLEKEWTKHQNKGGKK